MHIHNIDTSSFEPLHGERPYLFLDIHPDGRHIAMQVLANLVTTSERACVWDQYTGKRVWAPEGVSALAWLPGGKQVALIQEEYKRSPDHPDIIGSPMQNEYEYTFVRTTWPDRHFIDACGLTFPLGWPCDVVVSPRSDLAVVQWRDQEESGLEFVTLASSGVQQIKQTGFPTITPLTNAAGDDDGGFPLNTALVTRPVFSPDGRYIVLGWQDEWVWWSTEPYIVDVEEREIAPTSLGGDYTIGMVSILDWQERTHRTIPLVEHIPIGWYPAPRADGGEGLIIDPPEFVDPAHFTLVLPTGTVSTFTVTQ